MDPGVAGQCPLTVRPAVMTQHWERLTFLHWAFEPSVVQELLPAGLTVETFDGQAWVGLVPFRMWVAPFRLPALPWLGRFCETNVRTYVTDSQGCSGVWFFSLDAARFLAVVTARVGYRLPYFWARMSLTEEQGRIVYTSRRTWPAGAEPAAGGTVIVRPGAAVPPRLPRPIGPPLAHYSDGVDVSLGLPRRVRPDNSTRRRSIRSRRRR